MIRLLGDADGSAQVADAAQVASDGASAANEPLAGPLAGDAAKPRPNDTDLKSVVDGWESLSPPLRAAILALDRTAGGK